MLIISKSSAYHRRMRWTGTAAIKGLDGSGGIDFLLYLILHDATGRYRYQIFGHGAILDAIERLQAGSCDLELIMLLLQLSLLLIERVDFVPVRIGFRYLRQIQ